MLNFKQNNRNGAIAWIDNLMENCQNETYNVVVVEVISYINRAHEAKINTRLDIGAELNLKRALQHFANKVLQAKNVLPEGSVVLDKDDWRVKLPESPQVEPAPDVLDEGGSGKVVHEAQPLPPPKKKGLMVS